MTRSSRYDPFECMECGCPHSTKQAERALYGSGCRRCGGSDIDEAPYTMQIVTARVSRDLLADDPALRAILEGRPGR